jgi:hypothetical protein
MTPNNDHFHFQIPDLTDAEADVAGAFVTRMHEIAQEGGRPLDLYADGGIVLVHLVREMLPGYSTKQSHAFMVKVLESISGVLDLSERDAEGRA